LGSKSQSYPEKVTTSVRFWGISGWFVFSFWAEALIFHFEGLKAIYIRFFQNDVH
jgi:hypothetical protein